MITEEKYWKGPDAKRRDEVYADEVTDEIRANAKEWIRRYTLLAAKYAADTGRAAPDEIASGWRPAAVNEATANAASKSKHLTAEAGDLRDDKDGSFAWWCYDHQHVLALPEIDLYMEHPVATVMMAKRTPWCHLQTVGPRSGARCYFLTGASIVYWDNHKGERK